MGNNGPMNVNNKAIKESWEFHSELNHGILNLGQLKGTVCITEDNEIQIKGILRQKTDKPFSFKGFKSSKPNNYNGIAYTIKNENRAKFYFRDDILMSRVDNENSIIKGNNIGYEKYTINLKLHLYLPKPKTEKSRIIVNNYQYSLLKLDNPIDKISNSLCGMKNLINTCYINSSFQILIHIPKFVEIIRANTDFEGNIIGDINGIFDQILINFKNYRRNDPSEFVTNFKREHIEYNNHYQKDSQMFLEELIWSINSKLSILDDKRKLLCYKNADIKEKLFYEYMKEIENDSYYKIYDLFYVCFVHEKKCASCGYVTYYFDESTGLKLNFKMTKYISYIDLYTLIMDNFKEPERIKSSFLCQNCKKCFYILDKTRIAKLPEILILTLQKTNIDNTEKITWIVKYDNKFGIREIVDTVLFKHGSCTYQLYAINNHVGYSTNSGHYYSTIYLEKLKSWFSFNDESVSQLSEVIPN